MLTNKLSNFSCCWYHKGTNFQANHNRILVLMFQNLVVADTTKVQIFKQITTNISFGCYFERLLLIPQRYKFSSKSQRMCAIYPNSGVVADTTKVQIFKQITTESTGKYVGRSCCWYHKGTNFQANHNRVKKSCLKLKVVADTTKVQIFKQITTR